ncbi:hypothetical protein Tco_0538090 [Tanacetum coccineum]
MVFRESVSHLSILTDSIILILVLSLLASGCDESYSEELLEDDLLNLFKVDEFTEMWTENQATSVKVDAYIRGLSENIKGEVASSRPTNLNEAVRMAHKLMEQKS